MATVGTYLAQRLKELGLTSYFAIPGDFNLTLLGSVDIFPHSVPTCRGLSAISRDLV